MFKLILMAVVIVLACMGLAELLHLLWLCLIAPKSKAKTFMVVWLDGEDAARRLTYAGTQLDWLGRRYAEYRIAVYDALSPEDAAVCGKLAQKYDMVYCPAELTGHVIHTLSGSLSEENNRR